MRSRSSFGLSSPLRTMTEVTTAYPVGSAMVHLPRAPPRSASWMPCMCVRMVSCSTTGSRLGADRHRSTAQRHAGSRSRTEAQVNRHQCLKVKLRTGAQFHSAGTSIGGGLTDVAFMGCCSGRSAAQIPIACRHWYSFVQFIELRLDLAVGVDRGSTASGIAP